MAESPSGLPFPVSERTRSALRRVKGCGCTHHARRLERHGEIVERWEAPAHEECAVCPACADLLTAAVVAAYLAEHGEKMVGWTLGFEASIAIVEGLQGRNLMPGTMPLNVFEVSTVLRQRLAGLRALGQPDQETRT